MKKISCVLILVDIPFVGQLNYSQFKKKYDSSNVVNQSLNNLSNNMDQNLAFSVIKLCHYLLE